MTLEKLFLGVGKNFLTHSHYEYVRTMVRDLELPTDEFYVRNFHHNDLSSTAFCQTYSRSNIEYFQTLVPSRAEGLNYLFQTNCPVEDNRKAKSEYIVYGLLPIPTDSLDIINTREFYDEYIVSHGKSDYMRRYINEFEEGSKFIEHYKQQKREDSKLLLSILEDVI
jgi:hypothetical protein